MMGSTPRPGLLHPISPQGVAQMSPPGTCPGGGLPGSHVAVLLKPHCFPNFLEPSIKYLPINPPWGPMVSAKSLFGTGLVGIHRSLSLWKWEREKKNTIAPLPQLLPPDITVTFICTRPSHSPPRVAGATAKGDLHLDYWHGSSPL